MSALAVPPAAPLGDLAAWSGYLEQADIPVLATSAAALQRLRAAEEADEGSVDANRIGEAVACDPLLTLRVLAHAARHRPPRLLTDPQTVTAAVVLMGIPPFFHAFAAPPTVEQRLAAQPQAQAGLRAALHRATRAAAFALAFAAQRGDADAALIHQGALLHDFAALLLWCHAPDVAAASERQAADSPQPELAALQWALADAWRLPALLRRPVRDRDALLPRARCVALAVQLAQGDTMPALLAQAGELLALAPDDVLALIAEAHA